MNKLLIIICLSFSFAVFSQTYSSTIRRDLKDVAIDRAIIDFTKSIHGMNEDSIFFIDYQDSVYTVDFKYKMNRIMTYGDLMEGIMHKDKLHDLVSVSIYGLSNIQLDYNEIFLNTFYIYKKGKLFFWLDKSLIKESSRIYELARSERDQDMNYKFKTNLMVKLDTYYFCRKDPLYYERKDSIIKYDWYNQSNLNCDCLSDVRINGKDSIFQLVYPSFILNLHSDSSFVALPRSEKFIYLDHKKLVSVPSLDTLARGMYHYLDSNVIELISYSFLEDILKEDTDFKNDSIQSIYFNHTIVPLFSDIQDTNTLLNRAKDYCGEYVSQDSLYQKIELFDDSSYILSPSVINRDNNSNNCKYESHGTWTLATENTILLDSRLTGNLELKVEHHAELKRSSDSLYLFFQVPKYHNCSQNKVYCRADIIFVPRYSFCIDSEELTHVFSCSFSTDTLLIFPHSYDYCQLRLSIVNNENVSVDLLRDIKLSGKPGYDLDINRRLNYYTIFFNYFNICDFENQSIHDYVYIKENPLLYWRNRYWKKL